MANTASNIHDHGEFWRPPLEIRQEAAPAVQAQHCASCGTEYAAGSRFCHACGANRNPGLAARSLRQVRSLDFHRMQGRLGLPLASAVALLVGVFCTLAAIGTGLVFSATTVLDWQAVQIWRIEWLLGAVAAFLAGILLKAASNAKDKQD